MDKLLSNGFDVGSLPEDYIFPPEDLNVPFSTNIPVIDLTEAQNVVIELTQFRKLSRLPRSLDSFRFTLSSFRVWTHCLENFRYK